VAENDAGDAVYTVRRGLVKLIKQSSTGTTRIVRLLGPGAAVGLEAVKEGVYWHTAVAMQETGLCRIPFEVIEQLQRHNAQVADRMILQWEKYVEYADRWIMELSAGPVKARARRLIGLLVEITDNASGEIVLPSTEDLAAILGASMESVSRAMAEIKREKVLTRIAPRTYRCDWEALLC
jgi:CRP-like cAMP-binding protein